MRFNQLGFLLIILILIGCKSPQSTSSFSGRFVYFWFDAQDRQQLFLSDINGAEPVQLTSAEVGVGNGLSLHDDTLIYTQQNAALQESIWLLTLAANGTARSDEQVLPCGDASCQNPVWASDGRRVVYERRNAQNEAPRLFWLDTRTGETLPVFNDEAVLGYRPQLSADDRYLSFVHIPQPGDDLTLLLPEGHSLDDGHGHGNLMLNQQRVLVYDFETGEQVALANLMNSEATWRTDSAEFLLTDMSFYGERFGVSLMHVDPAAREMIDISGENLIDDASPSWSPDGEWIAFNRKSAGTAMGRQIWMMRPNGSQASALTSDADWNHARVHFSADGNLLLFQRFNVTQPQSEPSIWLLDRRSNAMRRLIDEGARPLWLP